jgi:hypothetical protein
MLSAGLCHLADWTRLAVLLNVLPNAGPPVVAADIVHGFLWSKVSKYLVHLSDDHFSKLSFVQDDRQYAQHRCTCTVVGI